MSQVGQVAQLRRYLPGQLVEGERQPFQVGQVPQLRRYLPGQLVGVEIQPFQVGQVPQLRRYLPAELVLGEAQPCQVGQVAQLRRYPPGQLVAEEVQIIQVGQVAQLRRYLPSQLVEGEAQPCQVGQVPQLRRYLPGQLVVEEAQMSDPAVAVGGYSMPFPHGGLALPVVLVAPVRSVRGVVEGAQRGPVGGRVRLRLSQPRAGHAGKGHGGNRHHSDEKSGNRLCHLRSPPGGPRGWRRCCGPHAEDAAVVPVGLAHNALLEPEWSLDVRRGWPHRRGRWMRNRTRRAAFLRLLRNSRSRLR